MNTQEQDNNREKALDNLFDIICTLREQVNKYHALEKSIDHNTETKKYLTGQFIIAYGDDVGLSQIEHDLIMRYYGYGGYKPFSMRSLAELNDMPVEKINAIIKGGLTRINNFFYSQFQHKEQYEIIYI